MKFVKLFCAMVVLATCGLTQTVPSSYFGQHVQFPATAWPTANFNSQRLWDSGVAWAVINTAPGTYNWTTLDAWMTSAGTHGVTLLYTFGRTPAWASSNPTGTCAYAPGQCYPPANLTNWDNFVTAIVTRSAGRIHYWELWNEPNLAKFYSGTTAQLVTMSQHAYNIIKSIDPTAVVVTPAPTFSTTWPGGSDPSIWMGTYLTAGGGAYADVVSFHGYPDRNNPEGSLNTKINNMKAVMSSHGIGSKPLWDTEMSWGISTDYPDLQKQAGFLARTFLFKWGKGVARYYWYGWETQPWGTLWDSGGGIHPAGTAYGQVYNWMVGATVSPCVQALTVYTCDFSRTGGYTARAVWNTAGSSTYSTTYETYKRIDGTSGTTSGGSVTIGTQPILLEGNTLNVKNAPYNAVGNGVADDTSAINSAIADLTSGGTLLFPCGTYKTTSQLTINKSVTVDGSGCAIIRNATAGSNVLSMSGGGLSSTTPVTSTTPDQATGAVANFSAIAATAGSYVLLSEGGKDSSTGSTDTQCDVSGCRSDVMQIQSLSGSTAAFSRPLSHPYAPVNAPTVRKINSPLTVTVKNITFDGGSVLGNGLALNYAVGSTITGVTFQNFTVGGFSGTYGFGNSFASLTATTCGSSSQGCIDVRVQNRASWNTISVTGHGGSSGFGFSPYENSDSAFSGITVNLSSQTSGRALKAVANAHNNWNSVNVTGATGGSNGISLEYYSHHNTFTNCTVVGEHAVATFGNFNDHNSFTNCTVTPRTGSKAFSQSQSFLSNTKDDFTTISGGTWTGVAGQPVFQMNSNNLSIIGVAVHGPAANGVVIGGFAPINNTCMNGTAFSGTITVLDVTLTAGGGANNFFNNNTTPHGTSPSPLPTGTCGGVVGAPPPPNVPPPPPLVTGAFIPAQRPVVVVALENHSYENVVGNSNWNYFNNTLIAHGGLATAFYANGHDSGMQYHWLTEGTNVCAANLVSSTNPTGTCHSGTITTTTVNNIVRQMILNGITWKTYQENIPARGFLQEGNTCPSGCSPGCTNTLDSSTSTNPSGTYLPRHQSFEFIAEVRNGRAATYSASSCNAANNRPDCSLGTGYQSAANNQACNIHRMSQFTTDVAGGLLPDFSFISPNVCDDGHNCGSGVEVNTWFVHNIAPLLATSDFQAGGHGLLAIWWDEGNVGSDNRSSPTSSTGGGGRIAVVLYGPDVKQNYKGNGIYKHPSLLRTLMEAMGMESNFPGQAATAGDMAEFFGNSSSTTPSILTSALPDGMQNKPYNAQIAAAGGTGALTFALTSGALPTGLTLSTTGTVSGTPTTTGVAAFTCTVTDGAAHTSSRNLTLNIVPDNTTPVCTTVGGSTAAAGTYSATTTKTAETSNNTSATASTSWTGCGTSGQRCKIDSSGMYGCDDVAGTSACWLGNPSPKNVSKLNVHTLLYGGATTKVYIHTMPWFCLTGSTRCDGHVRVGYDSNTNLQVQAQLADMKSRGFDGLLVNWYESHDDFMLKVKANIGSYAPLKYAVNYDGFNYKNCNGNTSCIEDILVADLTLIKSEYLSDPNYLTDGGLPVIQFFGLSWDTVNWPSIKSRVSGGLSAKLVFRYFDGSNPYGKTNSDGAYGWMGRPGACGMTFQFAGTTPSQTQCGYAETCSDMGSAIHRCMAKQSIGHDNQMTFEGAHFKFDNRPAPWGGPNGGLSPPKFINPHCGQTWLNVFKTYVAGGFGPTRQLSFMSVNTWNDYDEVSEFETGIDNCWSVSLSQSNATLSWTLSPRDPDGAGLLSAADATTDTIDHFTVYVSGASTGDGTGEQLGVLQDNIPVNKNQLTYSLPLSTFPIASGANIFYVKAVGKPSLWNQFSNSTTYTRAIVGQPPVAGFGVAPTQGVAPLTVNTDSACSTDPDGTIDSRIISWGDGTANTTLPDGVTTASHTFTNAGTFDVVLTVIDNSANAVGHMVRVIVTDPNGNPVTRPPIGGPPDNPNSCCTHNN